MKTTTQSFENMIQEIEEILERNRTQRQKDYEHEVEDAQTFAAELAADPKLKELFMETDSEIGLAKLIHQRTGVSLY